MITKKGIVDYLEILQMSGLADWGPFDRSEPLCSGLSCPIDETLGQMGNETAKQPAQEQEMTLEILGSPTSQDDPGNMIVMEETMKRPAIDRAVELEQIAAEVTQCRQCLELAQTRTQTVFGVGNPYAELVFLGEAPGGDEDKQGIPFVGRAGQLLTDMITKGMGLTRESVYICNILRCRPPGNRNPAPSEAAHCRPFLDATLRVIQPKYICCLGAVAAQNFLETAETIGRLRGMVHHYNGFKVVCTYHPAYLLRDPSAKGKAWEDLQLLMKEMGLPIPPRSGRKT